MSAVTLIFPHQLFQSHPALQTDRKVYLIEEWLFFRQFNFHKQKLILHRSSMKFYEDFLFCRNYTVNYIDTNDRRNDIRLLVESLATEEITGIHIADVADNWLLKRIRDRCKELNIELFVYPTPGFLNEPQELDEYFENKKIYFQTDFYIRQRKSRNILLEASGKPLGGKWSFDAENRLRFPRHEQAPAVDFKNNNSYIQEAEAYIEKHFPGNYGSGAAPHFFASDFSDAEKHVDEFLQSRLWKFGFYEDAIVAHDHVLYHSALSPLLNTGLLLPQQVLDKTLHYASENDIPLNSLEGFIRQIIGWREFIRLVYEREGTRQRTTNYWKFDRKIPGSFWSGTTGILPVDITIKKVLRTGYCHHIERLMVLANFMLLCEFDPDDVYRWFMELFIDAYDWVMVPNVYGMTQFADGGLMTTKPYISGSNYLMKMSNYPKGEWQQIWDGLFWNFMNNHRDYFSKNTRLSMLLRNFDKLDQSKRKEHISRAENYLATLSS